jgi:hypothetical protein
MKNIFVIDGHSVCLFLHHEVMSYSKTVNTSTEQSLS